MPWCEDCGRYWSPPSVTSPGACPGCRGRLTEGEVAVAARQQAAGAGERAGTESGAPWHFWVFLVAAAAYLGWRAVEGVVWVVQALT